MMIIIRKSFNNKGLTLIEMMVVLAVLSIIILGLVSLFSGGIRSWVAGQNQLKAQREARQVMDRMVREIREASRVDNTSGIYKINFFVRDFDNHSNPDIAKDFLYNETDREIKEGSASLLKNVSAFSFSYYDNNGLVVDPPDSTKISIVVIYLAMDVDSDGNSDTVLESKVNLRNFMLTD